MKINRNNYAQECTEISLELETLKNKLFKIKNKEKLLDNGLTNISKLYCELIDFSIDKSYTNLKIHLKLDNNQIDLEIINSNIGNISKL